VHIEDIVQHRLEAVAVQAERLKRDVAVSDLEGRIRILEWMATVIIGLNLLILASVFALWVKLSDIGWQVDQLVRNLHP
jgi:hypothetical protein